MRIMRTTDGHSTSADTRVLRALRPANSDPALQAGEIRLPAGRSIAVSAAAGSALGVAAAAISLLRAGSRGSSLKPIFLGATAGAAVGGMAILIDRSTGNHLGRLVDAVSRNRHTIWMLMQHPTRPWIGSLGRKTYADAETAQASAYGARHTTDDGGDAFRHAYGSALFAVRMMRDHGLSPASARSIVIDAGRAHERDTWAGNTAAAHAMDEFNNAVGAQAAGDGHRSDGTWMTEADVRREVFDRLESGDLRRLAAGTQTLIPTSAADLPADGVHE